MFSREYLSDMSPKERREIARLKTGAVDTGHIGFDRQANHPSFGYVGTGNVASSVQRSSYIRAKNQMECNGAQYERGELQNRDISRFTRIPDSVRHRIALHGEDDSLILYEFGHMGSQKKWITHGWILTDDFHRHLFMTVTPNSPKSMMIMDEMRNRVSWVDNNTDPEPETEPCHDNEMTL